MGKEFLFSEKYGICGFDSGPYFLNNWFDRDFGLIEYPALSDFLNDSDSEDVDLANINWDNIDLRRCYFGFG